VHVRWKCIAELLAIRGVSSVSLFRVCGKLTIWVHLYFITFLQSACLTLVTSAHVNHTVAEILTVVAEASSHASLEETTTTVAGEDAVVFP
jgi:hypothetical protein